jgi:hypothetical protein
MTPDLQRLETEATIWLASVRPDGRPHLVPIWFVWLQDEIYILTQMTSVKARNLLAKPQASVALEDGLHPLIAECSVRLEPGPYSAGLIAVFKRKYDWDITKDGEYTAMFALTPRKWLSWNEGA